LVPVVLGTRNVHMEVPSIFLGMSEARSRHGRESSGSVRKRHGLRYEQPFPSKSFQFSLNSLHISLP
jgi:hypothetical protein